MCGRCIKIVSKGTKLNPKSVLIFSSSKNSYLYNEYYRAWPTQRVGLSYVGHGPTKVKVDRWRAVNYIIFTFTQCWPEMSVKRFVRNPRIWPALYAKFLSTTFGMISWSVTENNYLMLIINDLISIFFFNIWRILWHEIFPLISHILIFCGKSKFPCGR